MKLMFSEKFRIPVFVAALAAIVLFTAFAPAQSRRSANQRRDADKKTQSRVKDARKDPKKLAALKKAEIERRKREEERQRAVAAERRRREEAIRAARARKIAFERGLRTETVANISKDKTDGEDLNIRRAAIEALGSKAGSVVVMEAQTGKILTVVNQDWAIRSSIKPCSTIKLVTGVGGLNEGIISKQDGAIRNTSTRLDLDDAIAFSNNGYFQRVGSQLGNAKMINYARQMGLGQQTGINAAGESAGKLAIGNNNARIYSHGDDFEVTTLQLAVVVSAMTNGGVKVIPHIPRNEVEKTNFQDYNYRRLDVPQTAVRRMIPGMIGAAEYGTAHRGVDASLGIAGKTGSCISKGSWVGLFASVAPIEKPKYSVVVITRGQSERGKYAAAVAGKIYRTLSPRLLRSDRNLAQTEFNIKPKKVDSAKAAVKYSDEEDDSETTNDNAERRADADMETDNRGLKGHEVVVIPSAPRTVAEKPSPKKLVQKTVQSKPLFPPVVITYNKDGSEKKQPSNHR